MKKVILLVAVLFTGTIAFAQQGGAQVQPASKSAAPAVAPAASAKDGRPVAPAQDPSGAPAPAAGKSAAAAPGHSAKGGDVKRVPQKGTPKMAAPAKDASAEPAKK